MVPGVQSFGRPPGDGERHLLSPEQLRAQLAGVRSSKSVVVLLVDLLDASGSFFTNVRQLTGANPIVLVGTKVFALLYVLLSITGVTSWALYSQACSNAIVSRPWQLALHDHLMMCFHLLYVRVWLRCRMTSSQDDSAARTAGVSSHVITVQVDLLPKGTSPGAAADWLQAAAANKRLSPISTCVVSSRTGQGISAAAAAVLRQRRGRDVYVMGAANVGKSAFIRCLLLNVASARLCFE